MRADALKTRQIAERWSVLAEQRLSYLTELFDSGRWRRFHNEIDFLENIQEAKANLDRWQAMARGEFVAPPVVVKSPVPQPVAATRVPQLEAILAAEPRETERMLPHLVVDNDAVMPLETLEQPAAETFAVAPVAAKPVLAAAHLDLFDRDAIVERYPMLRAAM